MPLTAAPPSPPAGINFAGADEVVHSCHSNTKRAKLIPAMCVGQPKAPGTVPFQGSTVGVPE